MRRFPQLCVSSATYMMELASSLSFFIVLSLLCSVNCDENTDIVNERLDLLENEIEALSDKFNVIVNQMTYDKSDLINKQKRQIISLKRNLEAKIQKDVTKALAGKLGEENNGMVQSNVISQLRHVHRANQQMRRQINEMKASFRQVEADNAMYRDALNRSERENSRYIKQEFKPEPTYTFQNIESDVLARLTGSTSSLIYLVKTCRDNNFLLHENLDYSTGEKYEVVVGGWSNTQSAIIKGIQGPHKDVIKLAGLVSCTEFRPFWLSWANDIITVGKGNILGKNELLRWRPDPPMEFNFVSYSSYINNQGIWKFLVQ